MLLIQATIKYITQKVIMTTDSPLSRGQKIVLDLSEYLLVLTEWTIEVK